MIGIYPYPHFTAWVWSRVLDAGAILAWLIGKKLQLKKLNQKTKKHIKNLTIIGLSWHHNFVVEICNCMCRKIVNFCSNYAKRKKDETSLMSMPRWCPTYLSSWKTVAVRLPYKECFQFLYNFCRLNNTVNILILFPLEFMYSSSVVWDY